MNRAILFALLMGFWILLTWPAELQQSYWQDLVVGAVASLAAAAIMGRSAERPSRWLQPQRYAWALAYMVVLGAYIVRANLEVAYRVLHPSMPISPGIVRIKSRLRRPSSLTALSNSITLTPGTLAVDVHEDGTMLVHWIYVRSLDPEEAARQIIGRFEWYIERIFE